MIKWIILLYLIIGSIKTSIIIYAYDCLREDFIKHDMDDNGFSYEESAMRIDEIEKSPLKSLLMVIIWTLTWPYKLFV